MEFEFGAGEDARPQVAKTIIQDGYELLEMRPIGLSLEEIFLELTRDNVPDKNVPVKNTPSKHAPRKRSS